MGVVTIMHVHDQLLPYLERQLSPAEHARVKAHLKTCAACRAQVAALGDLTTSLEAMPTALDQFSLRRERQWAAVWTRVTDAPRSAPYPVWQMALSISVMLLVVVFSGVRFNTAFNQPTSVAIAQLNPQQTTTPLAPAARPLSAHTATATDTLVPSTIMPLPIQTPIVIAH